MSSDREALQGLASRLAPDLSGYGVELSITNESDVDALTATAAACPDEAFRWTFVNRDARGWNDAIDHYAATDRLIYVVRSGGRVLGQTGYYDLEYFYDRGAPDVCEVGHTWYTPEVRGTHVNPACKLLLFSHAFETWGVARIGMRTDARNATSRAAMLRLGMTFEGIRRRHMLGADAKFRDSAYFSAVIEEWPGIKSGLLDRLGLSAANPR